VVLFSWNKTVYENLTVKLFCKNAGTELNIGKDIQIVFRGDTTSDRLKVVVEALREKRIERVKVSEEQKKRGKVFIAKADRSLSGKKQG